MFDELKKIDDDKIVASAGGGQMSNDELEKRRAIMKNLRSQIDKDEAVARQKKYDAKVNEMEAKEKAKARMEADKLYEEN